MSYDLAVWDGERPLSEDDALSMYIHLTEEYLEADPTPPSVKIRRYVDALVQRWPDNDAGRPWAVSNLIEDASGPIICLNLVHEQAKEAVHCAADLAARTGWCVSILKRVACVHELVNVPAGCVYEGGRVWRGRTSAV
jgi:hypothetical protein